MRSLAVRIARDGKYYPASRQLPREQRNRARWAVHRWACDEGRSLREAQALLLEELGIRRSLGSVHNDWRRFTCGEGCLGGG